MGISSRNTDVPLKIIHEKGGEEVNEQCTSLVVCEWVN